MEYCSRRCFNIQIGPLYLKLPFQLRKENVFICEGYSSFGITKVYDLCGLFFVLKSCNSYGFTIYKIGTSKNNYSSKHYFSKRFR